MGPTGPQGPFGFTTTGAINGRVAVGTNTSLQFDTKVSVGTLWDFQTSAIKGLSSLGFNSGGANVTPTGGYIRVPYGALPLLNSVNPSNNRDAPLLSWGDFSAEPGRLTVGDVIGGAAGVRNVHVGMTGGALYVDIAGTQEYAFGATAADLGGNMLSRVGSAMFTSGSDVAGVRRFNGLDGSAKATPNLSITGGGFLLVVASGPIFFIEGVEASETITAIPTMAVYGDVISIENRSAFTCAVNQTGTGMGTPSGFVAHVAPTMGVSLRFGSGYWELAGRRRLSGGIF